jgi:hypothetical protein
MRKGGNLESLNTDGTTLLKCVLKKRDGQFGPDSCGSGNGQVAGSCERGNDGGISLIAEEIIVAQNGFSHGAR